jgi:hypothetical protein
MIVRKRTYKAYKPESEIPEYKQNGIGHDTSEMGKEKL